MDNRPVLDATGAQKPEASGGRTLDSGELASTSAAAADATEVQHDTRTLEYEVPPGGPQSPARGGEPAADLGRTQEYGSEAVEDLPAAAAAAAAAGDSGRDQTLQLDGGEPADAEPDSGATLRSDELSAEAMRRELTAVWGEEIERAPSGTTIKGRSSKTAPGRTTLVINSRGMRKSAPSAPAQEGVDYDLWAVLGEGGMGVVYSARQASIDRSVAVKMLKPETAADQRQRQKFLSEAVITGDLDHPNIVPIYELGHTPDGALFYSMKRVQGTPWDTRIGQLSLQENLSILLRVADAVAFAHSRGVIHRDLKPENVMLGDFGEVLVMDWGLAIPTEHFKKSKSVGTAGNMGGTPAYMAPEMASGPFQRITYASDVYLLGAILYEIVTGQPPHAGSDVMKCLAAAVRNRITPTDRQGELVDIARRAMATRPQDRHASVPEFQAAVREYLSHSESVALTARAEEDLAAARTSGQYRDYAQALFAFREAAGLWEGNDRARQGSVVARADYAAAALDKGDYDLGLSLLDPQLPEHRELYARLERGRHERDARQRRLQAAKRAVATLLSVVFVVITAALVVVHRERNEALWQKQVAEVQRQAAEAAERRAVEAKRVAEWERASAEQAKLAALAAQQKEARARRAAEQAEQEEAQAREAAEDAKLAAGQASELAKYRAYVALIGLAAAKIDENAFGAARTLLDECDRRLRNWEWGRLSYLCRQGWQALPAAGRLEAVAVSADGRRVAAGGWNGMTQIWQRDTDQPPLVIAHDPASCVHDLDFSADGRLLATGSSDSSGWLRLWDAHSGQLLQVFEGHQDSVLSVRFSRDGQRLLSSSFDGTARLWNVADGRLLQTFSGHSWWVWSARFSPDETRIVTASQDGTVLVWSVETGQTVAPPFQEHRRGGSQAPVYIAAFAPDGRRIASGGLDDRILLWAAEDIQAFDFDAAQRGGQLKPQALVELTGHKAAVHSIEFSSDGRRILSGSQDNAVNVWDATEGRLIKSLRGHDGWVRSCRFADQDRVAISASHDATVRLWDIAGYEEARVLRARVLEGHADAVLGAAFSRDGSRVVTASQDQTARTWRVEDGGEEQRFREGHEFTASTAAFFADGKRLMTSASDNTTRIWDVTTGSELAELRLVGTGRQGTAAVSQDGRWILSGGEAVRNGSSDVVWTAQLWDAQRGQRVHLLKDEHAAEVTAVAISPDARWLFTGDANGRCVLWDRESGRPLRQFSDEHQINAAAFLPQGGRLLTANQQGSVRQWLLPSAEEAISLRLPHPDGVASLALTRDGSRALTSCGDGLVRLWDVERAEVIRQLEMNGGRTGLAENLRRHMKEVGWDERQLVAYSGIHPAQLGAVLAGEVDAAPELVARLAEALETRPEKLRRVVVSLAISPDETTALTVASEDRVVRLWNLATGEELQYPAAGGGVGPFLDLGGRRRGLVWSAAFAPGGQHVVTVGGDAARLWDLRPDVAAADRQLMVFSPHGAVAWADLSPDGRYLVTASWDNSARVWEADTARTVCRLGRSLEAGDAEHRGRVHCAVFSPDGRWILTTSADRTAKLWSTGDWQLVRDLTGHDGAVLHGTFTHDSLRIATSSADGTVRLWDAETGQLLEILRGQKAAVRQSAFSADDRWLVTGGADNRAVLWDLDKQPPEIVHRLSGHTATVTSVAFSPDPGATRVLTGSEDYTAILWDAVEGQEILTLKGHTQEVTSVGFSPDGRLGLTGSRDGTAVLWLTESWLDEGRAADGDLAGAPHAAGGEPRAGPRALGESGLGRPH